MKKLLAILAAVALAGCAQSPNAHVGADARLSAAPQVSPVVNCYDHCDPGYTGIGGGAAPEATAPGPIYVYVKPAGGPEFYH